MQTHTIFFLQKKKKKKPYILKFQTRTIFQLKKKIALMNISLPYNYIY